MPNALGLRIARKNTSVLIAEDPRSIILNRPVDVSDGAGGRQHNADLQLPAQVFRIIPLSGLVWDRHNTTSDEGNLADVTMQLLGEYNADVIKNDWFPWTEDQMPGRYIVMHVSPHRHYRVSANLRFQADDPAHGGN